MHWWAAAPVRVIAANESWPVREMKAALKDGQAPARTVAI
jgi:hypothetical protein